MTAPSRPRATASPVNRTRWRGRESAMLPGVWAGTATEAGLVAVRELAVDPRRYERRRRPRRGLARDLLEQRPFPVGQVRRRPRSRGADERRVGVVREHLHLGPPGDAGRAADVVGMEVRQ